LGEKKKRALNWSVSFTQPDNRGRNRLTDDRLEKKHK
jgi:hypothetical protein